MTFQTPQNNEENRGETSKTDLDEEIRSTWLEIAEGFQTFEAQDDTEIEQEINEIRALFDEEDEEQS